MNQRSKIGPTSEEKTAWKCNSSEYNNRYVAFTSSQQVVAKPPAVILSDNADTFRCGEDMAKDSSYMYDYAEKPSSAPIRVKRSKEPSSIAAPKGAQMDCTSSYKSCFNQKDAKPAKAIKPPPPQGLGWKNGGDNNANAAQNSQKNSVSMNCYRPYTANEVQTSLRQPIIISPEYGTIDTNPDTRPEMAFQTTVQSNFVQHKGKHRPDPAQGAVKKPAHGIAGIAGADINAKMDLTTTHRDVFSKKPSNVAQETAVPPLAKDKSSKTPKWYKSIEKNSNEGVSTQRQDYIHHDSVMRPKSFKPILTYNPPETKFETGTLYKNAFTTHGNQRRKPMVPATRTKEDEIIRHCCEQNGVYDTEYERTFQKAGPNFSRPRAIVPKTTNRSKGQFFDSTSYSANFNCDENRHIARMPSFKPKKGSDPWQKSKENDHFRSTTRDHYKGKKAMPAAICRPKIKKEQGITDGDCEPHFDTEYQHCFAAE